ncbi:hypothetical protein PIB30_064330 [Stylosanthes scabra]|uniref:Uncharacterized protein n=1 Tax=Stylosanthes scabra TaxID=79078 RepID=A0ABU6WLG8_9FABA|nr:hypothetical protein [Stylosanthes scabra]
MSLPSSLKDVAIELLQRLASWVIQVQEKLFDTLARKRGIQGDSINNARVDKDAYDRITEEEIKGLTMTNPHSGGWREDPREMLTKQGKELWLLCLKILIETLAHFFLKL